MIFRNGWVKRALLLCAAAAFLVPALPALAGTPHAVYGTVQNENGSTPADGTINFTAYIQTRPTDTITQSTKGGSYSGGYYNFDAGNFSTAWAVGDTCVIEFSNTANGQSRTVSFPLTSAGADVYNVTLQAPIVPVLGVTPTSIDFGSSDTSKTFNAKNTGNGTLTWSLGTTTYGAGATGWITNRTPTSGSSTGEDDTVTVTASRAGLNPGTYTATIPVTSNGGNQNVSVSITVPEAPVMAVTPTTLNFGTGSTSLTFTIDNTGTGTLDWSIGTPYVPGARPVGTGVLWITSVSPTAGTTTTELDTITVQVSRAGLTPGPYSAVIPVTSDGGNQNVTVNMTVPETPTLNVTPTSLTFGTGSNSETFQVSNAGTGTLDWTVGTVTYGAGATGWVASVLPGSGSNTSAGGATTVTVTANRANLPRTPGTYTATIPVTSDGGNQNVTASITVPAVPQLNVNPTTVEFGNTSTSKTFGISNTGTGTLTWEVQAPQYGLPTAKGVETIQWITNVSPTSGTSTTETDTITLTASRAGLQPGTYYATIQVLSDGVVPEDSVEQLGGASETVTVSIVVPETPVLTVAPTSLDFGTAATTLTFDITNTGNGTLDWTIAAPTAAWLTSVAPNAGSTTVETDTITATVSRAGLDVGVYTTKINVASDGGNAEIPVVMTVLGTDSDGDGIPDSQDIDEAANQDTELVPDFLAENPGVPAATLTVDAEKRVVGITVTDQDGSTDITATSLQLFVIQDPAGLNPPAGAGVEYVGQFVVTLPAGDTECYVHYYVRTDDWKGTWWKYIGGEWVQVPVFDSQETSAGSGWTIVTIKFVDNGPYDANPAVGVIADPSGPGIISGITAVSGGGGGCFIATAAFGSYQEAHVWVLRRFRDRFLLTNPVGAAFVRWYYAHSPRWAAVIAGNAGLRAAVRTALLPVYAFAWLTLRFGALLWIAIVGLLLAGFARGRRPAAARLPVAILCLLLCAAAPASAMDFNHFDPTPGEAHFVTLSTAQRMPAGTWRTAAFLSYAGEVADAMVGGVERTLSENQAVAVLGAAYGVADNLQLGVSLPCLISQDSDAVFTGVDDSGFGNLQLSGKYTFMAGKDALGLAMVPFIDLQTGDEATLIAADEFGAGVKFVVDRNWCNHTILAFNLGYAHQSLEQVGQIKVRNSILFGAGLSRLLGNERTSIAAEIVGRSEGGFFKDEETTPMEALVSVSHNFGSLMLVGGLGTGLNDGYGTANLRGFAGVRAAF